MVEAASLPLVGLTALQALRDELGVRGGDHVLLNGASGGVGTVAIQIGKALGARVTAVCSDRNAELVRSLGADAVLDYRREDISAARGLDHVFDIYGTLPYARARPMLRPGGRYCTAVPSPPAILRGLLRRAGLHRAALVVVRSRREDLEQLTRWVQQGALAPVVDRVLSLEQAAEGHAYLETRRARGKVVLEVASTARSGAPLRPR
jgi:NADPH:quinone reductase-like Zn-dependent oxidoreductase